MEPNTATYKEMYNGKCTLIPPSDSMPAQTDYINTYWHGDISLHIGTTHKLAQDKPTLTWQIPIRKLGMLFPILSS